MAESRAPRPSLREFRFEGSLSCVACHELWMPGAIPTDPEEVLDMHYFAEHGDAA